MPMRAVFRNVLGSFVPCDACNTIEQVEKPQFGFLDFPNSRLGAIFMAKSRSKLGVFSVFGWDCSFPVAGVGM